jgi:hypothetical protein
MFTVLRGTQNGSKWSDPSSWWNNTVPASSKSLEVVLNASSEENLGTASSPFVVDNLVGVGPGLTHPSLNVSGFLDARNIVNLSDLQVLPSGDVSTSGNLVFVQSVEAHDGGDMSVGGSLLNVGTMSISFGSTVEVGHSLGNTAFSFGIGGGTLFVDHPAPHAMGNKLALGPGNGQPTIELAGLQFDQADFIPNAPGSSSGKIDLLNNGAQVYQLSNVTETGPAGILTTGVDAKTGHDFIAYHF